MLMATGLTSTTPFAAPHNTRGPQAASYATEINNLQGKVQMEHEARRRAEDAAEEVQDLRDRLVVRETEAEKLRELLARLSKQMKSRMKADRRRTAAAAGDGGGGDGGEG